VPLAYGSGFERSPDLLAELAVGRELLGSAPAAVRRAKDAIAFAALLGELGIPHPAVRRDLPGDPEGWLAKRTGGAGGGHVRLATDAPKPGPDRYFQRHVPGRPISVLLAGDGRDAASLGFSEQWSDPAPGRPYRYGGAAVPAALPADLAVRLADAACRVAAESGLRGLGSVDALVDADRFHVLELNLRPGASLDAYERACGRSLVALHVAACRGSLPYGPLALARAAAAALVRAPERTVIPEGFRWPVWSADRGAPGTVVAAGGPVCTVLGEGRTAGEAREVAETRALTLLSRLQRHAQRAG
jgi:predicted ATP-grasp superfamily ATP-dependent carboligase